MTSKRPVPLLPLLPAFLRKSLEIAIDGIHGIRSHRFKEVRCTVIMHPAGHGG